MTVSLPFKISQAIDVWSIQIEDAAIISRILDASEMERQATFYRRQDAEVYAKTRSCLRLIISLYLGIDPALIKFHYNKWGKPFLDDPCQSLHFNVSHSGSVALIAVSRVGPVGVDVEEIVDDIPFEMLHFFTELEHSYIDAQSSNEKTYIFTKIWTLKEAYLKLLGVGLSRSLKSFELIKLSHGEMSIREFVHHDHGICEVTSFEFGMAHLGSLAYRSLDGDKRLRPCHLPNVVLVNGARLFKRFIASGD